MNSSPHHHFASFFKNENEVLKAYAYAASKNLSEGSICIDVNADKHRLFANYQEGTFDFTPNRLKDSGMVGNENEIGKPFVLNGTNLYITRYFNYETQIIKGIKDLIESGNSKKSKRFEYLESSVQFRQLVENRDKNQRVDWQLVASILAFVNNFNIITGGPGTGKTTTVAKILNLLFEEKSELNVKLAAPTGKAAMRMKEALNNSEFISPQFKNKVNELKPFTIHRLLGSNFQSPYFKHNAEKPVEADVIIVDEASMIDVALFSKLITAIDPETRLILLGDKDQLASVEAGSLFGDLCGSVNQLNVVSEELQRNIHENIKELNFEAFSNISLLQDHIIELRFAWRFIDDPTFKKLSSAVINGDEVELKKWIHNESANKKIQFDISYEDKLFNGFARRYRSYIENNLSSNKASIKIAIEEFNKLRILAVIKNGRNGVKGLNQRVEKYLSDQRLINRDSEFYEHRPVMVTRNHPELNLFNGDIGIVRKDPDDSEKIKIFFIKNEKFEEGEMEPVIGFSPALLTDVETVFAMTVHKSQGSEFESVMIVMPKSEDLPLLTRELLYTGITRAKKELLVQGSEKVILKTASARVKRASGIIDRIEDE